MFIRLIFLFICGFAFSQDKDWGKVSQEEIDLKDVTFEPGAEAVKLKDVGFLKVSDNGYELEKHERIKILSTNGFVHAQRKWSYRIDRNNDDVILRDAQTINIIDGKIVITPVEKKDIIISKNDNVEEIIMAFPNVRVGSIIEYKVKISRPYNLFSSPWQFQDDIPTIFSILSITSTAYAEYTIILNGEKLTQKYKRKRKYNDWELENIPSDKVFKHVYNVEDFTEKLMLQYNSMRISSGYFSKNSWGGFKKLVNKDIEESIKKIEFQKIANQIKNGSNKKETLENCIQYLRDYFRWNGYLSFLTDNLKKEFLQTKTGNSSDFNILLREILKLKNIKSELAINSLRSNGQIIVAYPAFSKLQTLVNIVETDNGEKLMIDAATSDPENIRFLSLNFFNHIVLGLDYPGETFLEVSPSLSEFISQQSLEIKGENSVLQIDDRAKGYFNTEPFRRENFYVFSGAKSSEPPKQTLNEWKTEKQIVTFENPNNSILITENPFTKTMSELSVADKRNYPIALNFPFLSTVQLKSKLPENYTFKTENFNQKISAFGGNLQYVQSEENIDNEMVITWSLLLNKIFFQTNEIAEYNKFINDVTAVISKAAVIKKK